MTKTVLRLLKHQSFVYFVKATKSGLIKIGASTVLEGRLAALQTGSAEPLEILAAIEGDRILERDLHGKFHYCRSHGEWFHPDERLLAFIQKIPPHKIKFTHYKEKPAPKKEVPGTFSVSRAARFLGCTSGHIFNLIWADRLAGAKKYGRSWAIPWESCLEYRDKQETRRKELSKKKFAKLDAKILANKK